MSLKLERIGIGDARKLWQMQVEAFAELLEKYQDFETNPGAEKSEKVAARLKQPFTYYYLILDGTAEVGAIRVVDKKEPGTPKRISPIFILKEYRGRGYAQEAIHLAEQLHGSAHWALDTILQEKGNCHLYEKLGYRRTGKQEAVNDRMTLVFYEKE